MAKTTGKVAKVAKTAKPAKPAKAAKATKKPKSAKPAKPAKKRANDEEDDHEDEEDDDIEEDCSKLVLPSGRVTLMLRKALVGKRFGGDNGVFATGVIEHVVNTIVLALKKASGSSTVAGKPKRADYKTLIRVVRSHPDLSRVFSSYTFSPSGNSKLKISPQIFLNKADRAVYTAKRAAEKEARAKARVVPAVDEE